MSDGSTISQDEIDALLGGVGGAFSSSDVKIDTDTLQKFFDGVKPKVLNNINGTSGKNFEVTAVNVESTTRDHLLSKLSDDVISVYADFNSGVSGEHSFFVPIEFAQKMADADEYNDDVGGMIQEIMGSISGAEITDIGSKIPGLASDPPNVSKGLKATARIPDGSFALMSYSFTLDGESFELYEAISANAASGIASALGGGSSSSSSQASSTASAQQSAPQTQMNGMGMNMGGMGMMGMQQPQMQQMPPMMGGMGMMGMQQPMMNMQQPMMGGMGLTPPNVQSVQYPNLQGNMNPGEQGNIGLIMDVFMEMTVELGRTKKQIREILGMGEGTIIELDKLAGEPVDILVNHKPIAKGEVVVIDENFGVRVTEILSPMERVSDVH